MTKYAAKRKVERIRLAFPLMGRVGSLDVVVLDVSLLGCRLEHHFPLRVGNTVRITFRWEEKQLELEAHIVRCSLATFSSGAEGLTVYHSGLRFTPPSEGATLLLRDLIAEQISRALEEQKANARGDMPRFLSKMAIFSSGGMLTANAGEVAETFGAATSLPYVRIARERGYVTYTLDRNYWKKKRSRDAAQPDEGFTVWAYEDESQIEQLAKAYEKGDAEMRALIRICAEWSLIVDDSIPPQRFQP